MLAALLSIASFVGLSLAATCYGTQGDNGNTDVSGPKDLLGEESPWCINLLLKRLHGHCAKQYAETMPVPQAILNKATITSVR
jgi:hypothetical protein